MILNHDVSSTQPPSRRKAMAAAASWLPWAGTAQLLGCPGRLLPLAGHGEMFMVRVQLGTLGHTAQKWEGPPGSLTQSINRLKNDTEEWQQKFNRINRSSSFPAPATEGLFSILGVSKSSSHMSISSCLASVLELPFAQEAEPSS